MSTGLSVSGPIRLLMIRIADEKCLPFQLKAPNAKTQKAITCQRTMTMRITPQQTQSINQQVSRHLGGGAEVWLFGSRVDDQKKGGDVDLYIEAAPHPLLSEIRCKIALEDALDMPVDLIVRQPSDTSPIAMIAKNQGLKL